MPRNGGFDKSWAKKNPYKCVFTEGCTHGVDYSFWYLFQLTPPYVIWIGLSLYIYFYKQKVLKLIPNMVPGVKLRLRKLGHSDAEPIVELNLEGQGRMLLPDKRWVIWCLMFPFAFITWYLWDTLFVRKHASYMFPTNLCHDAWDCFYTDQTYTFLSWPKYRPLEHCDSHTEHEMVDTQHFYKCYNWMFSFAELMACSADVAALCALSLLVTVHRCSVDFESQFAESLKNIKPPVKPSPTTSSDSFDDVEIRPLVAEADKATYQAQVDQMSISMRYTSHWVYIWLVAALATGLATFYFYGEFVTTIAGLVFPPFCCLFLATLTKSREKVLHFVVEQLEKTIENEELEKLEKADAFLDTVEDLSFATKHLLSTQAAIIDKLDKLDKPDKHETSSSTLDTQLAAAKDKGKALLSESGIRRASSQGAKLKKGMSVSLEHRILAGARTIGDNEGS